MRQICNWMLMLLLLATMACGGGPTAQEKSQASRLIDEAYQAKDYARLLRLADSLQQRGDLTEAEGFYWQGYASDRMLQRRTAEFFWQSAMSESAGSTDAEALAIYVKSASRLTNGLSVRGDYESALKVAVPAAKRLEELGCDTTSDYTNLLIFIGCCQTRFGLPDSVATENFERAYEMHQANIEKRRNDESYKNAIAGIINIAYNYNNTRHYKEALAWTDRYGELVTEYERRSDAQPSYVDKQWGRYHIYRAIALEGLGRHDDAAQVYDNYQQTLFSQTPEGHVDAADFLIAAKRWGEAADAYRSLDRLFDEHQSVLSLENIQKLVRKYQANMLAGRLDSANVIARRVCESLDSAITQSRRQDAEEQETIRQKETQISEQLASITRQRLITILLILGLLFCFLTAYALYRRKATRRLAVAHEELKTAYGQLETTTKAKQNIESELRIAHDIQMSMLPVKFPQTDQFELHALITPAKEVSGDFYDFYVRDDKLFFCIGDVSGKGVPASLVMAVMRTQFRTVSLHEDRPDRIVSTINAAMAEGNDKFMFVTFFVGVLDLQTGRLRYCNAGHDAPLLIGSGIGLLPVDRNIPVGLRQEWKFTAQDALIDPGTVIFLYTDGLTEAEDGEHRLFGQQRMMGEALQFQRSDESSAQTFIERMATAIQRFVGDAEQSDDLTMLAVRYLQAASGLRFQRSISLHNDVVELPLLAQFMDGVCKSIAIDASVAEGMKSGLQALMRQIMTYAYPAGTRGAINVEAAADDTTFRLVISDHGQPFDPMKDGQVADGETDVRLVSQTYVAVGYERTDDQNVLTLTQRLATAKTR